MFEEDVAVFSAVVSMLEKGRLYSVKHLALGFNRTLSLARTNIGDRHIDTHTDGHTDTHRLTGRQTQTHKRARRHTQTDRHTHTHTHTHTGSCGVQLAAGVAVYNRLQPWRLATEAQQQRDLQSAAVTGRLRLHSTKQKV